jgi:hypothetical protein
VTKLRSDVRADCVIRVDSGEGFSISAKRCVRQRMRKVAPGPGVRKEGILIARTCGG